MKEVSIYSKGSIIKPYILASNWVKSETGYYPTEQQYKRALRRVNNRHVEILKPTQTAIELIKIVCEDQRKRRASEHIAQCIQLSLNF